MIRRRDAFRIPAIPPQVEEATSETIQEAVAESKEHEAKIEEELAHVEQNEAVLAQTQEQEKQLIAKIDALLQQIQAELLAKSNKTPSIPPGAATAPEWPPTPP